MFVRFYFKIGFLSLLTKTNHVPFTYLLRADTLLLNWYLHLSEYTFDCSTYCHLFSIIIGSMYLLFFDCAFKLYLVRICKLCLTTLCLTLLCLTKLLYDCILFDDTLFDYALFGHAFYDKILFDYTLFEYAFIWLHFVWLRFVWLHFVWPHLTMYGLFNLALFNHILFDHILFDHILFDHILFDFRTKEVPAESKILMSLPIPCRRACLFPLATST
jgi:hypothetical protein